MVDYLLVVFTALSAIGACAACVVSAWSYHISHGPDVVVYLESDSKTEIVYLCIGNFGDRTAHNVSVSLSEIPQLEDEFDREHLELFINAGISTLPPGLTKKTSAGTMSDIAYSDASKEYVASVDYSRKRGGFRAPKREYSLDFRSFWEAVETVVQC